MPINSSESEDAVRNRLKLLYDRASIKSLGALNQSDAESEMLEFLREARAHPEQRAFVVRLFMESVALRAAPWQLIQFCIHDLRWPEVRDFIKAEKARDVQARGARSSTVWNSMLEAFDDDWEGALQFDLFRRDETGPSVMRPDPTDH